MSVLPVPEDIDHAFQQKTRIARFQAKDGSWVSVEYFIEIDWAEVREMAHKAARNKSKRSKFGPVKVHAGNFLVGGEGR